MIIATPSLVPALAPVARALTTVRRRRGAGGTSGLAPGLIVPPHATGWTPATELLTGSGLDELLAAAKRHWQASPHAAATLAWRSYTYWLAMPVVAGWATARRVVLVDPADVLLQIDGDSQLLVLGLRRLRLAVLPDDPLAGITGAAADAGLLKDEDLRVVDSPEQLLAVLRDSLRTAHLDPLLDQLQTRARLGARPLLGSLASAVAYAVVRGTEAPPSEQASAAEAVLRALDVDDLVTIAPGPAGLAVQRHTCCLAFTLPQPKVCSGCCLRTDPQYR